ncbi:cation diffusion facilitator family transporter [Actinomadura kijaniata]|uniref:cation diffusion facilitator family transporter n=1 Tax=Actinomadura kijaniata TaxID=46161 RepID=UPI000A44E9FD|nr:cation diffusion facilitator family transporter [Actinomadura kijaniata]
MDTTDALTERRMFRLLWLAVAAAVATIALKTVAWLLTGSVGLLSDAAESVVNLVAAVIALGALRWATKPADEEHSFGHTKAEYFSAGAEGMMIFVAAAVIGYSAVERLLNPQPLERVDVGVAVSIVASLINLAVGWLLLRGGRRYRSITLEADGRHLITDVWTSAGVVVGVAAVALTGWSVLDPIIALVVAANILWTGAGLVRRSGAGLMDRALEEDEQKIINDVLAGFAGDRIAFHAVRTRRSGRLAFVTMHILVPGDWTVRRGHDLAEEVETAVHGRLPHAIVLTHVEPIDDPRSYQDTELETTHVRTDPGPESAH